MLKAHGHGGEVRETRSIRVFFRPGALRDPYLMQGRHGRRTRNDLNLKGGDDNAKELEYRKVKWRGLALQLIWQSQE